MKRLPISSLSATILMLGVVCIAIVACWWNWSTRLEAFAFVTGAICVWLVVRENIWNFPIGLMNVTAYAFVFFRDRLFADAGLQVLYFILGVIGWAYWVRNPNAEGPIKIVRASHLELLLVGLGCIIGTIGLWALLERAGGSIAFWDGLTSSISLAAQWLLTRKRLENWLGWIVVDLIYVPMYFYKELYLTSLLYALFLAMAIVGLVEWHHQMKLAMRKEKHSI